jgi:DNA-binding transcriptional MerR regulator
MDRAESALPPIPAKRYFTIGEVSELCLVKPYVLRYWEQEFVQLKPMKRRGNRRYYQHHEVLLIRRIRELLYEQGFTISGARNQLADMGVVATLAADSELDSAADGGAATTTLPGGDNASSSTMPATTAGAMASRRMAGADKKRPSPASMHGGLLPTLPAVDGRVARALQASQPAVADAAWMGPALPDLDKLSPQSVMALREALLSIRDLLS